MINHELRDLFSQNSIHKRLVITHDGGTITNSDLLMEEFSLEESLSSEEELRFGSCEASVVRFPVSNVFTSLNGKVLDISMILNGQEDKPLKIGKYKVTEDVPTADRRRRDIVAYDVLYDVVNADVAEWYNALLPNNDSAVTFKQFRDSFFGYFGIEQVNVALVNDGMIVTKTIQPTELSGSMVANAICELNGCFGHINRDGLMDYVFLKGFTESLYPSDDLFPEDDLYPADDNFHRYTSSDYAIGDCDYQDYVVRKITGLEIRQAENSIGAFIGTKENPYVVSDNFLTYGKSTDEMTEIATKMFVVIKDIEYRPFTINTFRGNPCVEVGDAIRIYTGSQIINSYVLQRNLTGIQALHDDFETRGREYRTAQVNSFEKSLIHLRGKTNTLERTVEETRSEITKQTAETKEYAEEIAQDALDRANKNTNEKLKSYSTTSQMLSEITQTAENINLEVEKQITETKEYADNSAQNALENAENSTDEKLKSYSTTSQMNSAISQSAQGIRTEVSQEITATKTYAYTVANSALQSANANTDNKLKSYSTTTQMNSAIDQTASSIRTEVSKTYATKDETEELSSEIEQTAESVAVVIDKNGNIVTDLTLDKNGMTFVGNYIVIDTANLKLDEDGAEFSGYVEALSLSARDIIKMYQQGELGVATEEVDVMQFISKSVTPNYSQSILLIGGDGSYIIRFVSPTYFNSSAHVAGVMSVGGLLTANGGIDGSIKCVDKTARIPIGSANNSTNDIAYITSKAKNASGSYLITVNGLWETDSFASHNIVSASSDIRLKENIADTKIKNALEVVNKFKVREFDWKESGTHQDIGFVADELQEIDERLAVGGGYEEDGTPNYKTVDSFYMQGYLVKAIQELSQERNELRKEMDELKKSVSFLMERLGGMEDE